MGVVASQSRTMVRAASSFAALATNILRITKLFVKRGYPEDLVLKELVQHAMIHKSRLPVSY